MVELHYHLDGGLRPKTVFEFYQENAKSDPTFINPFHSEEEVRLALGIEQPVENLTEALDKFEIPLKVLQTPRQLERVSLEAVVDLYHDGVDYAEIRYSPLQHLRQGLSPEETLLAVIKGVEEGQKLCQNKIRIGIILCMMRGQSKENNCKVVDLAIRYQGSIVCGLDLAGDELKYPLSLYVEEFQRAKEHNIPFTIHAGEVNRPGEIQLAVSLGAKRIGHATSIASHPEELEILKANDILVECCISSNYKCKGILAIEDHPIRKLFDYGIKVLPCVDDSALVLSTTSEENRLAKQYFSFSDTEMEQIQNDASAKAFITQ